MSFSLAGANIAQFKNSFEVCPIFFSGGIAANLPGGLLPITSVLQPGLTSIVTGQPFASFKVMPGGKLGSNEIGRYPFANQATAGNAIIAQPLNISLEMFTPAATVGSMPAKLPIFTTLKATLDNHTALGGLFIVCTPALIYENAIYKDVTDITPDGPQVQARWQWDFELPLITLQQAQMAQNNMMSKISAGVRTDGALSGTPSTVGSQVGGAATAAVPGAQSNVGGTVQGASPLQPFQTDSVTSTTTSVA
jgi:hypothetical protein